MADTPWLGDACSLVEALRAKELSPVEALDASLAAIEGSELNAFSHVAADEARAAAEKADVSLPFGGVPTAVKELQRVKGWPFTEASLLFKDHVADVDGTEVARLRDAGAVLVGLTTASEIGFVNYTSTKLNGTTRNPWNLDRTPGGSSGGSAAAVSGGLVPIATGGDGGGSIRIPSGYSGLFGLKATYGRFPRGPYAEIEPLTVVLGCLARSVRDSARWVDAVNGYDPRDPHSLPRVEGWEAGLGTHDLSGLRVALDPTMGGTVIHPEVEAIVRDIADAVIKSAGLKLVDVDIEFPQPGPVWAMAGLPGAVNLLQEFLPDRADELTDDLRMGLGFAEMYRVEHAARLEQFRVQMNEAMADLFEQVDMVICATNPYEAFAAEGPVPSKIGSELVNPFDTGRLTIPANMTGHPAVSIPAGLTNAGLPVGMQVYGRRHEEALLLDLALTAERERPWPLVATGAPV
ncbi:MAG: amidase, Asp-tRNAAsn/Glu-tRNAGln amidotransferase subunit [Acidimicrobiales bacterium]|nr:amidase, Asp-tRNAAsn/Glu-tRNAGln amidotransferase subunit [Acidimicrobiales bacterium]